MVAREPARVHFHARFDVRREREMRVDHLAEPADFVRPQESGRAAAEMELHHLALRIEQGRHQGHFPVQILPRIRRSSSGSAVMTVVQPQNQQSE